MDDIEAVADLVNLLEETAQMATANNGVVPRGQSLRLGRAMTRPGYLHPAFEVYTRMVKTGEKDRPRVVALGLALSNTGRARTSVNKLDNPVQALTATVNALRNAFDIHDEVNRDSSDGHGLARKGESPQSLTQAELAAALGLHVDTVGRAAKQAGLTAERGKSAVYHRNTWLAIANAHCLEMNASKISRGAWDAFLKKHGLGKVGDQPKAKVKK